MKKIVAFLMVMGLVFNVNAHNAKIETKALTNKVNLESEEGIHFFKGTWEDALKQAQSENKLIFLDAMTSWCGPCKLMARKTFPKKEVGDFFNLNFISFKMDMEKNDQADRISAKFGMTAYPTLYFVDSNENMIHQGLGYKDPEQLIHIGKKALKKRKKLNK